VAGVLGKDLVLLKIDTDRMTDGAAVAKELRRSAEGGIPWMVILDGAGKKVADSDGPKGNTGYPAEPEEIAHFLVMLRKAARRATEADLLAVEKVLKDRAAAIAAGRAAR